MDQLSFPPDVPLPFASPPPPLLPSPLSDPAAAATPLAPAKSAASPLSHEAALGASGMGGVGVGASEESLASGAALGGDQFDITRIELSPSVDVQVARQQWERGKDVNGRMRRLGSESAEMEPPALSPEPHIGSVLDSFRHQSASGYELSGEAAPHLLQPPLRSPPTEEQPQRQEQRQNMDDSREERKASHEFFAPSPPLPHAHARPNAAAHAAPPYFPVEQQQPAQMAHPARASAYTYSQPSGHSHGRPLLPSTEQHTGLAPHYPYGAVPIAYQPSHQPQPAMYPPVHHPSISYYHTADNSIPAAHSQPSASHLHSVHSFVQRHRQLDQQRHEIVDGYRQLDASKHTRSAQDHALLIRHLEHRYHQVTMEMESTEWMLKGNVPLITAAEVPSIQHYAHEAQLRQQQQRQMQQREREEEEQEQEDEETFSEGEAAELEAMLAQSYEEKDVRRRNKSREESDRAEAAESEERERSATSAVEKPKKRKSTKRKRHPDAPPHSKSAYILFHIDRMRQWQLDHPEVHTNAAEQGKLSGAEWKELTDEQKRPYIEMALRDKQRVQQEHASQRPSSSSKASRDGKKSSAKGTAEASATAQSSEEKEASDERKEAMEKVMAVEEEFSELSPALSSRRPSDPSVQALPDIAAPLVERKAVAIHNAPFSDSPRPVSAMQLYISDTIERSIEEARVKGVRLLKGDARKAARSSWDQLTDTEKEPWKEQRERAMMEWQRSTHSATPPRSAVAAVAGSVTVQAVADLPISSDNTGGSERKEEMGEAD